MKRRYRTLSMMICDPKKLGNDIDVYLNALVEDLKLLWVDGFEVFDVVAFETFIMHEMLFCTINDFHLMVICWGTMSRVIKHVLYVKKTLHLIG